MHTMHTMHTIHTLLTIQNSFAGFSNITIVGKIFGNVQEHFYIGPFFSKYDWWVPMTRGYTPYFILGSNFFFLAVIHLFDITYLSKSFNLSEKSCKMIAERPRIQSVVKGSFVLCRSNHCVNWPTMGLQDKCRFF